MYKFQVTVTEAKAGMIPMKLPDDTLLILVTLPPLPRGQDHILLLLGKQEEKPFISESLQSE